MRSLPLIARQIRYEERVFAFIDVLGWSKLIADSAVDRTAMRRLARIQLLLRADQQLHTTVAHPLGECMTHFSDSVILSWPRPSRQRNLERIVLSLAETVRRLFLNRFLVRGAVVQGKVFHRPHVAFGPALVEAYLLESRSAIYPRVLVADSLASGRTLSHVRVDADGYSFVDFLALGRTAAWYPDLLTKVRAFLLDEKEREGLSQDVRAKYAWMVSYVNTLLTEAGIEPVARPNKR